MTRKRAKKKSRQVRGLIQRSASAEKKLGESEQKTPESQPPIIVNLDEAKLIDLAVDVWKLDKNVKKAISLDENMPIKSSLGKLFSYLGYYGIEVRDCTGEKYHENMNVRILSTEEIEDQAFPIVLETVKPAVIVNGKLVSHASVIIGAPKNNKDENLEKNEEGDDE